MKLLYRFLSVILATLMIIGIIPVVNVTAEINLVKTVHF